MLLFVRFGDLSLKGRNQGQFKKVLYRELTARLGSLDVNLIKAYDHFYLEFNDTLYNDVLNVLTTLPGLHSFSEVLKVENDVNAIKNLALSYLNDTLKQKTSFKLAVKRSDKTFPIPSIDLTKDISSYLLKNCDLIYVDVHNPDLLLKLDIRDDYCFLFKNKVQLLGGFPPGIQQKALCLISGGIDSPVAAFLMAKQGVEVECIHFESTPLTSLESAMKVYDLVKILAKFNANSRLKLHYVPFKDIHMELLNKVPEPYRITIMRRMMYRIAEGVASNNNCLCLISGESVGQVASQTLSSLNTINSVINIAHLRPLAGFDKKDIIKISKEIGTYETSIRPFEDCCTIYVPKNPAIHPTIERSLFYERLFPYSELVEKAIKNTKCLIVKPNSDLIFSDLGFDMEDVFRSLNENS